MKESISVGARQRRRVRRHPEQGKTVTDLDVSIDKTPKQALDKLVDRLGDLGRECLAVPLAQRLE